MKKYVLFYRKSPLTLSIGQYASLANSNSCCTAGNTTVLATVVAKPMPNSAAVGFTPFTVDYELQHEVAGRIEPPFAVISKWPVLMSRLIDRSLRPLFPADYNLETHIGCDVLAYDTITGPAVPSINAASLALAVSDIPWNGPVGAAR